MPGRDIYPPMGTGVQGELERGREEGEARQKGRSPPSYGRRFVLTRHLKRTR